MSDSLDIAAEAERRPPGSAGGRSGRTRAASDHQRRQQGRRAAAPGRARDGAVFHPRRDPQARRRQQGRQGNDPALRRSLRHGDELRGLAPGHADPLRHRLRDQGASGPHAPGSMGAFLGSACRREAGIRVLRDGRDERGHGTHHHTAPSRCTRACETLPEKAAAYA
jgi:hypothetical protein